MALKIEGRTSLEVEGRVDHFKSRRVSAQQGDGVAAKGVISDGDIGHLDCTASRGIFRQRSDGISKGYIRWCLVLIADRQAVAGADGAGAIDSGVAHRHREAVGISGLEIEAGACLEVKGCAVHLERIGISAQQDDSVGAEGIIGDDDIGSLDCTASGDVFRQRCGGISKGHLRWCLVQIADRQAVARGCRAGAIDCGIAHRHGEAVGVFGLVVKRGVSLKI